jgi:hypothetical protein
MTTAIVAGAFGLLAFVVALVAVTFLMLRVMRDLLNTVGKGIADVTVAAVQAVMDGPPEPVNQRPPAVERGVAELDPDPSIDNRGEHGLPGWLGNYDPTEPTGEGRPLY